jgi:hypothetical protein
MPWPFPLKRDRRLALSVYWLMNGKWTGFLSSLQNIEI